MPFKDDQGNIRWLLHLASSPEEVFHLLSTDAGRAQFWAESAKEMDSFVNFQFPNGISWCGEILENNPPGRFVIVYFGGTITTFALSDDEKGGTDLVLTDKGVPPEDQHEVLAGWVSVLIALKATVDFGVDLRNHYPSRTWDQGYADN